MPQCDHGRRPKRTRVGAEARRRSHGRYEPAAGRSRPIRFLFSWSVVRFTPSAGAALRQRAPTEANPGPSPTRRCSPGRHGAGQRRPLRFPFPWSVMRSPRSACAALPRRAPTDANSRSAPNPAAFPPGATSRPAPTPPLPPPVERDAFTPSAGAALRQRAPTEANQGPSRTRQCSPGRHGAGQRRPLCFLFSWSAVRSPRSACAALPRRAPTEANSRSAPNPAAFPPGATSRPAPTPPLPLPVERDAFPPERLRRTATAGADRSEPEVAPETRRRSPRSAFVVRRQRAPTEANPRPNLKPGGVPPGATSRPPGAATPSASSSRGAWWGSPRAPAPPASGSRRTGAAPAR